VFITGKKAYVVLDAFPVTKLHCLVIPKVHTTDMATIDIETSMEILSLIKNAVSRIKKMDGTITGFNIGYNIGKSGGQTIDHMHIHIIPRRDNDGDDPTGGIRKVINGNGNYR
jgi:diadenosine tetraphosphate (Ap4A) HIT family hydrolase